MKYNVHHNNGTCITKLRRNNQALFCIIRFAKHVYYGVIYLDPGLLNAKSSALRIVDTLPEIRS